MWLICLPCLIGAVFGLSKLFARYKADRQLAAYSKLHFIMGRPDLWRYSPLLGPAIVLLAIILIFWICSRVFHAKDF